MPRTFGMSHRVMRFKTKGPAIARSSFPACGLPAPLELDASSSWCSCSCCFSRLSRRDSLLGPPPLGPLPPRFLGRLLLPPSPLPFPLSLVLPNSPPLETRASSWMSFSPTEVLRQRLLSFLPLPRPPPLLLPLPLAGWTTVATSPSRLRVIDHLPSWASVLSQNGYGFWKLNLDVEPLAKSGTFMWNLGELHFENWILMWNLGEPSFWKLNLDVEPWETWTLKSGTFMWNLGEPSFWKLNLDVEPWRTFILKIESWCGTLENLNFEEWNLDVEPWETWTLKSGTFMWNLEEPELLRVESLLPSSSDTSCETPSSCDQSDPATKWDR